MFTKLGDSLGRASAWADANEEDLQTAGAVIVSLMILIMALW